MNRRPISLAAAKAQYVHRYTLEHVPNWARRPCEGNGRFYAPQYRSDQEWYDLTTFPGENGLSRRSEHCQSSGQTWPLGQWLRKPFPGLRTITDGAIEQARDMYAAAAESAG